MAHQHAEEVGGKTSDADTAGKADASDEEVCGKKSGGGTAAEIDGDKSARCDGGANRASAKKRGGRDDEVDGKTNGCGDDMGDDEVKKAAG